MEVLQGRLQEVRDSELRCRPATEPFLASTALSPIHCFLVRAAEVGQTSEVLAKLGSMTAPSRSRLGKWIPCNVEFPSPAQRAHRKQAVSSNSASTCSVCGGLQPAEACPTSGLTINSTRSGVRGRALDHERGSWVNTPSAPWLAPRDTLSFGALCPLRAKKLNS